MSSTNQAYTVVGGSISERDRSFVLAARGHTHFKVTVIHHNITSTEFGDQYFSLIEKNKDPVHGDVQPHEPLQFICEYCLPTFAQFAPHTSFAGLTLQDFVRSPCYHLGIVKSDTPGQVQLDIGDDCSFLPAFFLAPLKLVNLPPACKDVTWVDANVLKMDDHESSTTLQGKFDIEGRCMYFKPREDGRQTQFDRELRILDGVRTRNLPRGEIRVPILQGIVVCRGSEETCIGLFMNMIPTAPYGSDLLSPGCWARSDLHGKWEEQVTATVDVLHAHDFVWGDVNAGNVVIDENDDAWVIDFGGLNNPEFVDNDKAETIEGDWQGIRRLFQQWLPDRRAGVPW